MATRNTPAPGRATDTAVTAPDSAEFPMEVSDYATATVRVSSRVPDAVADLLEDLREAHDREVTVKSGQTIPAGQPKYKTVSFPTEEHAKDFKRHALSYSKGVMTGDGFSVRLSHISPTSLRVGVGKVVPKPRRKKDAESSATPETTES